MLLSRTIVVVTGSRAEFGLLAPVMRAIAARPSLRLRVAVGGLHLAMGTWKDVAAAGFAIDAKVAMQRAGRVGRAADVAALGRGIAGFGQAFARLKPEMVVVLGDRIEALAAACAASVGGWRLAHLHGGDRAEGVADEAMRHAISKMAHLHLAATAQSRRRLIRMGEHPSTVFNVGSPAIDALGAVVPAGEDLLKRLGLRPGTPLVIVVQHPVGASDRQERAWMDATLAATRPRTGPESWQRLVMSPNGDPGSRGIASALRAAGIRAIPHLPRGEFLALLAGAAALVGNSSAGLIEAAAVRKGGVPVVNVGPRQAGRERPGNVIDCAYGQAAVRAALIKALGRGAGRRRHPYGDGRTGPKVAQILAELDWARFGVRKCNAY